MFCAAVLLIQIFKQIFLLESYIIIFNWNSLIEIISQNSALLRTIRMILVKLALDFQNFDVIEFWFFLKETPEYRLEFLSESIKSKIKLLLKLSKLNWLGF